MGLTRAVTGAASDNLYDFGQGCTNADGKAALAPLPVEAFLGRTEGNEDVQGIAAVHAEQVGLQGFTHIGVVLNEVPYLQDAAIRCLDNLDEMFLVF